MTTRRRLQTLYLSRVRLERFKAAFEPGEIDLHPFTVLIGRNGSGKSTLLEALQWIDTSVRYDARRACERYYGIRDLINLRSRAIPPFFQLAVTWKYAESETEGAEHAVKIEYRVKVEQDRDGRTPIVAGEWLRSLNSDKVEWISTKNQPRPKKGKRQKPSIRSPRILFPGTRYQIPFGEPDRLALARGLGLGRTSRRDPFPEISDFWERAVFLRLSPNRLVQGSPAKRKSFDPLLDEEGQTLPALLRELRKDQMADLIERIRTILPDIRGIHLERPTAGLDATVSYSLVERMPYVGRAGRSTFQVPAWMLSEGTRRITAILALLAREPAPSLLCIEEIENGLDPWTTLRILEELQSASDHGVQVLVSSHSPWLLDHVPIQNVLLVNRVEGETVYEQFEHSPRAQQFKGAIPVGTRYVQGG